VRRQRRRWRSARAAAALLQLRRLRLRLRLQLRRRRRRRRRQRMRRRRRCSSRSRRARARYAPRKMRASRAPCSGAPPSRRPSNNALGCAVALKVAPAEAAWQPLLWPRASRCFGTCRACATRPGACSRTTTSAHALMRSSNPARAAPRRSASTIASRTRRTSIVSMAFSSRIGGARGRTRRSRRRRRRSPRRSQLIGCLPRATCILADGSLDSSVDGWCSARSRAGCLDARQAARRPSSAPFMTMEMRRTSRRRRLRTRVGTMKPWHRGRHAG
jgi:hypothetical protein